jgi:hypothetical protein
MIPNLLIQREGTLTRFPSLKSLKWKWIKNDGTFGVSLALFIEKWYKKQFIFKKLLHYTIDSVKLLKLTRKQLRIKII